MCEQCAVEATGRRSGIGLLSLIMGFYSCEHSPDCKCSDCKKYRDSNKYADSGLTGNRPTIKE